MENTSVQEFLKYYESIYKRTMRVVELIPEGLKEWKPQDDMFSFGDILRHLFNLERFMFVESVLNNKNLYQGHGQHITQEPIIEYIQRLHSESVTKLGYLTDEQLEEKCITPDNIEIRKWKWLRAMIEHHVHHRAQLYTYLHMNDIQTPPIFGLTSEEVKSRGEST